MNTKFSDNDRKVLRALVSKRMLRGADLRALTNLEDNEFRASVSALQQAQLIDVSSGLVDDAAPFAYRVYLLPSAAARARQVVSNTE